MLDGLTGAACPVTAQPEHAHDNAHGNTPDVDDLLAAGTVPEPVISDELEALLNANDLDAWHAAPASGAAAAQPAQDHAAPQENAGQAPGQTSGNAAAPLPEKGTGQPRGEREEGYADSR